MLQASMLAGQFSGVGEFDCATAPPVGTMTTYGYQMLTESSFMSKDFLLVKAIAYAAILSITQGLHRIVAALRGVDSAMVQP